MLFSYFCFLFTLSYFIVVVFIFIIIFVFYLSCFILHLIYLSYFFTFIGLKAHFLSLNLSPNWCRTGPAPTSQATGPTTSDQQPRRKAGPRPAGHSSFPHAAGETRTRPAGPSPQLAHAVLPFSLSRARGPGDISSLFSLSRARGPGDISSLFFFLACGGSARSACLTFLHLAWAPPPWPDWLLQEATCFDLSPLPPRHLLFSTFAFPRH